MSQNKKEGVPELKEIDYNKERLESEGSDEGEDNQSGQESSDNDENGDSQFLSENPYQQVHKNNILGCATYVKWMRKQKYFFGLDMHLGHMLLYKKIKQVKPSTYYRLMGGRFEAETEYEKTDGDDIIRIRNKKGRRFRFELDSTKDPKKIRELLDLCFQLQTQKPDKGFYATLGRSVMQVQNQPFNVSSGIIVDMKKSSNQQDEAKKKKSKEEKERLNKIRGFKAVSSLFFSQSDLLREILGSISGFIINPFKSKALSQSFSGAHFAIGLVFKPISGTIDLIGKSSEYKKDHVIHANVFKVFKIINDKKTTKKNTKRQQAEEKERMKREIALQIHDQYMEKVFESDGEVLYLNRENVLGITKKDIEDLQPLALALNLEDVDGTLKVDIQYEQQKVRMNLLLDYYIKNRKEKSEEYEEDMCEFIVLQPIQDKSIASEQILKGVDHQKSMSSTYIDGKQQQCNLVCVNMSLRNIEQNDMQDLEEIGDEIGDERVGDCMNKQIPLTTNYHSIEKKETFNTNLPQFLVRDSPFKHRSTSPSALHKYFIGGDTQQNEVKIVDEGQLKVPFTKSGNTHNELMVPSDIDDEMQFHSFTNNNNAQESPGVVPLSEQNQTPQEDQLKAINLSANQHSTLTPHKNNENNKNIFNSDGKGLLVVPSKSPEEEQLALLLLSPSGSQINSEEVCQQEEEEKEESEPEDEEEEDEDRGISKAQDKNVYFAGTKVDLQKVVETFAPLSAKDEQRVAESHSKGGKQCTDKGIINTTRSVGKYIIGEIGRKIISGDFNLTTVSFPIKAMIPKSALQTALTGTCLFPIYMGIASGIANNPVERLKLVITATFANFPVANTFTKPLNPILGETFQASYIDGTKLFGEQISHHPPVSYFLAQGPNKSYQYSGYYLYEAKAGWNSLTLKNKGKRTLVFKDGHRINYNFGYEYYSGTFMGTMKHETLGEVFFEDPVNKIEALIVTGKVKKKPTDYIQGEIKVNGKVVSTCLGSYLGFIEFDGKRYWDFRHILPLKMNIINSSLQSDHLKRTDRKLLAQGQLKKAQEEKERLELIQRTDASFRKKVQEAKEKQLKSELKAANKKKKK